MAPQTKLGPYRLAKAVKVHVSLTNRTTKERLGGGERFDSRGKSRGVKEEWEISLVETGENSVSLDLPAEFCGMGSRMTLSITTQGLPQDIEFEIFAKVVSHGPDKEGGKRDNVKLEFVQFNKEIWSYVCSLFQDRQNDILRILTALKE